MRFGGAAVVLVLLLLGLGSGYLAATQLEPDIVEPGSPEPVSAADPSFPGGGAGVLADPDLAALAADTPLAEAMLGAGEQRIAVPAPIGWSRVELRPGEARWTLPGSPAGTHSVRVHAQPGNIPLTEMVENRRQALRGDPTITDLQIAEPTNSIAMVEATFVRNSYRKVTVIRWINFYGGPMANLEIAWTGRLRDEVGMQALMAQMARDARPIEPDAP